MNFHRNWPNSLTISVPWRSLRRLSGISLALTLTIVWGLLLFSPAVAQADGGNESGHGGDEVVRDFVAGWQLALKMVKDVDAGAFQMDNEAEEQAVEFFLGHRDELYDEILGSPQQWVDFPASYTLCGYTDQKHYAPFLMSKENCKGTKGDKAAAHFIGEGTHHFGHGDLFAALVANLVVKAYHQPSRGPARKRALEFKLIHEASLGNFNEVHGLLDPPSEVDPNCKNTSGHTPLMGAALAGDEISVNLLLARNAYVDTRDSSGRSVFAQLFDPQRLSLNTEKHRRIALRLAEKSLDKPAVIDDGLLWGVRLADADEVDGFLALGTTRSGRDEAFALAMQAKQFTLASKILKVGIHPSAIDPALREAIHAGKTALVRDLLAAGADLSLVDTKGRNAVYDALDDLPLLTTMLHDYHAPPDVRDREGWKPLGLALAIPIKSAPNPGDPPPHGSMVLVPIVDITPTPHTKTVGRPNYPAARLLVEAGADVTRPIAPTGTLPLALAAKQSLWPDVELVELMLSRGARPDVPDAVGFSAFDWVCSLRARYLSACRQSPYWNPDCVQKFTREISAMQKVARRPRYRAVPDPWLARAVPHTRTGLSEAIVRIAGEPEPPESYDFTQWCLDARYACD